MITRIFLDQPKVSTRSVLFSWQTEPASPLYHASAFTLRFPETIDLSEIEPAGWWTIFLACLHSHWPLLRPCVIQLPVRLLNGHRQLWERLLEAESNTLEAYRADGVRLGPIELIESGEHLRAPTPLEENDRCASAFSGGKDSLFSAGLLSEFTARPVLVTTTSPMPGKSDHSTARRRQVMAQIAARRDVQFVEVESDFRSSYDNNFAANVGYNTSINEISDTFLYFASLLTVGLALGVPHLFLASEAEVQENVERNGVIVQHPHYMYSTVTQRAFQALLLPGGIHYSSLTSPLHNAQVQQLLWRRYHDLSDLQYSCWRVGPDELTCSECRDCFRLALCALFVGGNPQRMGIDLVKLLTAMRDWMPRDFSDRDPASLLPNEKLRPENDCQIIQYIQRAPLRQILNLLAGRRSAGRLPARTREALKSYAQLRRRVADYPAGEPLGYRPGFLPQVDPLLRDKAAEIYRQYFKPEPEGDYAGVLHRGNKLADWISEPLAHAPGN